MRIGIDARLYGTENTGLGRYVSKLVDNLPKHDKSSDYVIFVRSSQLANVDVSHSRIKYVASDAPIYSLMEQLYLPILYYKENLDLLHVPHFNAPVLYFRKKIVTLHDLIKHSSTGKETTTRNPWFYWLKRLGYYLIVKIVVKQAIAIIVPTNFVKNELIVKTKISSKKIHVTYEAASSSIKKVSLKRDQAKKILNEYRLVQPYLVYTGNVYPHKNVDLLIEAVVQHNLKKELDLHLAIICARSVFWDRLQKKIQDRNAGNFIKLLGYLEDSEISKIYSLALALVHPSKMEGFGLTGIEAMSVGLPVISSSASCLPEIYGKAALYFDPNDMEELIEKISLVISDSELRQELSRNGLLQSKKYSWSKTIKETISVYERYSKK